MQLIPFGPEDIQAVQNGSASRGTIFAVLTSQTCGEPCWHAHEDICRCSCGGKNHGCLRSKDGVQPVRCSKINGVAYKLAGVGRHCDLASEASRINREAGWKSVEKATYSESLGLWHQYRYCWQTTDDGAPARLKTVSGSVIDRWPELAAFRNSESRRFGVYCLWVRIEMPSKPTELAIDRDTGEPLADQTPPLFY